MSDLFTRRTQLERMQNIPDMPAYAEAWNRLGADFEAAGFPACAAAAWGRWKQYRGLSGAYVRLFEGASMAELLEA